MSNTVEHKGNVYEIGRLYAFSDSPVNDLDVVEYGILTSVSGGLFYQYNNFSDKNIKWKYVFEISVIGGTITKAPIKLIDGEVYQFNYETGANVNLKEVRGMYDKDGSCVWIKGNNYSIDLCTNIVKPIPEASNQL